VDPVNRGSLQTDLQPGSLLFLSQVQQEGGQLAGPGQVIAERWRFRSLATPNPVKLRPPGIENRGFSISTAVF
jgi:hypothetical protein